MEQQWNNLKTAVLEGANEHVPKPNKNAKQKWIDMINDKNMGGIQLFANGWSQICKDYAINSIPRFMLFDREGNIMSVDAPRPSSDEIRKRFMAIEIVEGLEAEGIEVIEVIDGPKEL